jgi:hypothetical protein
VEWTTKESGFGLPQEQENFLFRSFQIGFRVFAALSSMDTGCFISMDKAAGA